MALPVDDDDVDGDNKAVVATAMTTNHDLRIPAKKVSSSSNNAANVELAKRMAKRMLEKERKKVVQAHVVDTTLDDFKVMHWVLVVIIVVIAAIALIVAAKEGNLWK